MKLIEKLLSPVRRRYPLVSVVPMRGIIGASGFTRRGLSIETMAPLLKEAFEPKSVKAVALLINSPGGSPVQSELIAARVRDLAAEHEKPVFAFVEDVAASGGYWLACAADEIFAVPTSIVGSIGVVSAGFGFVEAIEKLGVERRVHTAGTRKALLDPFRPEQDEDVTHLKSIQGEMHAHFIEWVQKRRGAKLDMEEEPDLFQGTFWTAKRGIEFGLVDGFGEVRRTMRERYGDKTRFRVMSPKRSLARRLGIGASEVGEGFAEALGPELAALVEERALWARFGL